MSPDRNAAPRIELVAPEAKLITGSAIADLGRHHRAVVLGDEERRVDAARGDRRAKPAIVVRAKSAQRGVEQRRVLALQQADAAEFVRAA